MKRIFLIFSVLIICLALAAPSFAQRDGRGGPKDRVWRSMTATPAVTDDASLGYRIGDEWHYGGRFWVLTDTTIGVAVWVEQVSSGASLYATSVIVDGSFSSDASGATLTQTQATLPITQILQGTSAGVIGSAIYDSSGDTAFAVMQDKTAYFAGNVGIGTDTPNANVKLDVNGTSLANEALGGTSTYAIHGSVNLNSLASATQALLTAGRIIEINATASPIVRLPDMSALSSVTNQVLFVDVTKAGNDSGVTIWSPTNKIYAGLASTFTSGDTIFVTTGNTGFVLSMKALNYGSGVTPAWRVWSSNANINRP